MLSLCFVSTTGHILKYILQFIYVNEKGLNHFASKLSQTSRFHELCTTSSTRTNRAFQNISVTMCITFQRILRAGYP
jgi:hypothetical protein